LSQEDKTEKLIMDSTQLLICKNIRNNVHKTFQEMAGWIYSSTDVIFRLRLHLVLNEAKKIVLFVIKPVN